MSKIGFNLGFPPEPALRQADSRLVLPYCPVGLEFEFERVTSQLPPEQWSLYWSPKRDNSLHDAGMEFVFRRPYFGSDVIAAVDGLLAHARAARYAVSIRTGFHVHVDVRDMEMREFVNMCALYALFERAIYRYIGDNRDENVFCLPWYKTHGTVLKINSVVNSQAEHLKSRAQSLRDEKYAGLNLDPLARFGSVEFRHALTTVDSQRALDWINICLRFKEAATTLPGNYQTLHDMLLNFGPTELGRRVFQDQFGLLDYEDFERDVFEDGVPIMLDVIHQVAQGSWGLAGIPLDAKLYSFGKWLKVKAPPTVAPAPPKLKKKPRSVIPPTRARINFNDLVLRGNEIARAAAPPPAPTVTATDYVGGPDRFVEYRTPTTIRGR